MYQIKISDKLKIIEVYNFNHFIDIIYQYDTLSHIVF